MRYGIRSIWPGVLTALAMAGIAPAQRTASQLGRQLHAGIREIDASPTSTQTARQAVEQLRKFDDAVTAKALLGAINQLQKAAAPITAKRTKILGRGGGSKPLRQLRYELINLDSVTAGVTTALVELQSPEALQLLLRQFTQRGSALPLWLRLRMADRFALLTDEQLQWRPYQNTKSDPATKIALLKTSEALGRRADGGTCGPWMIKQLTDDSPDVRMAAAGALGRLGWHGGIDALIDRLEAERGPVFEALLDALVALTNCHPGDTAGAWHAWRQSDGQAFASGTKPLSQGDPSQRKRKAATDTTAGTYFGIEQTGNSLLYVFDNSLSMQRAVRGGKRTQGGDGQADNGESRWQRCKRELETALRALPLDKRFNLLAFANRLRRFADEQLPATEDNIERAIQWLGDLDLELQTNTFDALEQAFVLAGRGSHDGYYAPDVDTVFMLSDGAPTIPNRNKPGISPDDSEQILQSVRRWNALSRITIHTVGLGLNDRARQRRRNAGKRMPPADFLRQLASQNGGQARMIKQ